MKRAFLVLLIIIASIPAFAISRKPAVEDFVIIESQGIDFNNPKTVQNIRPYNFSTDQGGTMPQPINNYSIWVLFGMLAALPLMSWLVLTRKSSKGTGTLTQENVHHLKDYRAEEDSDDDDISKAS